jgi:hypothetical protein
MSGGKRELGINARAVVLAWTAAPPTGYDENSTVRVPIMTPAMYNGLALGDTGTYQGAAVEVVSLSPETVK